MPVTIRCNRPKCRL